MDTYVILCKLPIRKKEYRVLSGTRHQEYRRVPSTLTVNPNNTDSYLLAAVRHVSLLNMKTKKTKQANTHLTPAEHRALEILADRQGMTPSALLRFLLITCARTDPQLAAFLESQGG